MKTHKETEKSHIFFFDGECGFCNRSLTFCLTRIRKGSPLLFAPLQGETAAQYGIQDNNPYSAVYARQGIILRQSQAVIALSEELTFPWRTLGKISGFIPVKISDIFYNFIARHRKKISAKKGCQLPTPEQAALILP